MARLLAQGTGARWAQVWLVGQDRLVLAATWPPDAPADQGPPDLAPGARDETGPGRTGADGLVTAARATASCGCRSTPPDR